MFPARILVLLASFCGHMVSGHAYMSDPAARNVPGNPNRQGLAAGGPYAVSGDGQYRHGLCGNNKDDAIQNWNVPSAIMGTYTEGQEIDISVVVTAHHIGYFDFQLCDTTDITEECFARNRLRRANCAGSGSVHDPNCERWWKPLANHETMSWVVTGNGGYNFYTVASGTVMFKAKYVLPQGVTCTNCVLRYHYYTTNSCAPSNANDNPNSVSEEFWNCADIAIKGRDHTVNTDASPELVAELQTRAPVNLRGTGMDNFCPRRGLGEPQEYANVVQCGSSNSMTCTYPGDSGDESCSAVDCGANGVCVSGACRCTDGYTGATCSTPPADDCAAIDCGQNGNCVSGTCKCTNGYTGSLCEVAGGDGGDGGDGTTPGRCGTCVGCLRLDVDACHTNWGEEVCNRHAADGFLFCSGGVVDPCADKDCGEHSTGCAAGVCLCSGGYTGESCELAPDVCSTIDCGSNGSCDQGACVCTNGFSGEFCEVIPDACLSLDCGSNGKCEAGVCVCENGYTGDLCTTAPDLCATVDCGMNGECAEGLCVCQNGYTGVNCEVQPDLCADVACGDHGSCVDGTCLCTDGYTGVICETAPDLCARVSCGEHGSCVDGVCVCVNDYTGANCEIEPVNPCANVNCGQHGTCTEGVCVCSGGYSGPTCEVVEGGVDCGTCVGCMRHYGMTCYTDWDEMTCQRYLTAGYTYCSGQA